MDVGVSKMQPYLVMHLVCRYYLAHP